MKNLIKFVVLLLVTVQLHSQEKNITTESVTLDNLLTFVIDHFQNDGESQNLTFLLKTHDYGFSNEDKFVLKQTFKILSKRLSEDDYVSISTYNSFSGVILKKTSPHDLKKILYALEYPKANIDAFATDGIELAYQFVNDTYEEDYENKVVMVRLPKREGYGTINNSVSSLQSSTTKQKGNGTALVLSALALLPEIISVIKN